MAPGLCEITYGTEPYRPKGESCSYSNTSRLYSRNGSDSMPSPAPNSIGTYMRVKPRVKVMGSRPSAGCNKPE